MIRTFLILFLLTAIPARAEVRIITERNVREAENAEFRFKTVPPLSDTDAAQDGTIEVLEGKADWGCEPKQLIDGAGPSAQDVPGRSFCFGQGTNGGRIRLDLLAIKPIAQINTYSWNNGARAPQVYTLYASDGSLHQIMPLGVACPRDRDDVLVLVFEHS